jgi:hypothetical protein
LNAPVVASKLFVGFETRVEVKLLCEMTGWTPAHVYLSTTALCLLSLLVTQAAAWGVVQFHGSRNCSSDTVSFARLCIANKCCTAIAYRPADQSQSAIGAKGNCANGRVTGKLYSAHGNAARLFSISAMLTFNVALYYRLFWSSHILF